MKKDTIKEYNQKLYKLITNHNVPKNYTLTTKQKHTFPDNTTVDLSKTSQKIISLKYKNTEIGIMLASFNKNSKNNLFVDIAFIQGIKSNTKNFVNIKEWYSLLLSSLITSTYIIKPNTKIVYGACNKKSIIKLKQKLKTLERNLLVIDKLLSKKKITTKEHLELKNTFTKKQQIINFELKTNTSIRDRYFSKDGLLTISSSKKRISKIRDLVRQHQFFKNQQNFTKKKPKPRRLKR